MFCLNGFVNGCRCNFKIDTGSDVTLIRSDFLSFSKKISFKESFVFKYPTGERVPIKGRVEILVKIGKFKVKLFTYVVDMIEECLLGVDFLSEVKFDTFFNSFFEGSSCKGEIPICSRVMEIPSTLKELFEQETSGLKDEQKKRFTQFLIEFQDVFSEEVIAGNCKEVEHKITLMDSNPIKQAPRRVPFHFREEVDKIIEDMKQQGVIEESYSPWVSPAVMVKKKDGSIRFCVDYRKLNSVTIKDSFPLPRIDDIFDKLSGNSWFSTLDLKNGYWQIKIRPEDKEKTAFSIGKGLWQFTVMPFGLCNAPATFERLMEKVLLPLLNKDCLVYLDDVIIFATNFDELLERLRKVFLKLRSSNLKLNPKKCSFLKRKIKYLGHVVSERGIATNKEKISAVKNWPTPITKKQIRSFLGFCSYYRRFVKGFSLIAKPLFSLTENSSKFIWTEQCNTAFEELKLRLTSSPILSFPTEIGQFILDTDASNHGMGAVLSQVQDGKEKVIAYLNKVFDKSERNYCVTRRELLAIIVSLKSFHHYLYGRKFLIRTDHISLRWLMSFKNLEGQLARWLEQIQQYDFEIMHRKGILHGNANGLSRRPCEKVNCQYCFKAETKEEKEIGRIVFDSFQINWREEQLKDLMLNKFLRGKEVNCRPNLQEVVSEDSSARIYWTLWDSLLIKEGVLYKNWEATNFKKSVLQIIVPKQRIKQILEIAHDSSSGGHFGINKTLDKIRRRFYWALCKQDVENWCRTCDICIAKKGPSGKGKSEMQIYDTGSPFERLQMDILGPFPTSTSGNKYLLVIMDCFTRWVEAFPLKNFRAKLVAEVFVNQFISRYGVPSELHTDQGKNFDSKLFAELSILLGIKKTRTTPLHPQSNGIVERQHQTIINYLAKFILENQLDWDRWIGMCLLALRSARHKAIRITPAEMCFGRDLTLPLDLLRGNPPQEFVFTRGNYVFQLKEKLNSIHEEVRQHLNMRSLKIKTLYDQNARRILFNPGQKVWLYNPRKFIGRSPKLQSNWEGPFEVVKRLNDVVYCIRQSQKHKNKIISFNN